MPHIHYPSGGAPPPPPPEPTGVLIQPKLVLSPALIVEGLEFSYIDVPTSQAVEFDGTSARIRLDWWSLPFEDIPNQDFTISFYAYMDAMTVHANRVFLASYRRHSGNLLNIYIETANSIRFYLRDNSANHRIDTVTPINALTWYHFAVTWQAATNTMTLYVNGAAEGVDVNASGYSNGSDRVVQYGARSDQAAGSFLDGRQDNQCVWSTVLSPAEIAEIYAGGWSFDPRSNSGAYVSSGSLMSWLPWQRSSAAIGTYFGYPGFGPDPIGYGNLAFNTGP